MLRSPHRLILGALLLLALLPAGMSFALDSRDPAGGVLVENPADPGGYKLFRPRRADEEWCAWFCRVFLWPHTAERYNQLFTTLSQNGRRAQFIPDEIYAAGGRWYLVLRGAPLIVGRMAEGVYLEPVDGGGTLRPLDGTAERCAACPSDIAFVAFPQPTWGCRRVMSSFPLFGDAGGVADVIDEEELRQRHPQLRDWVEDTLRGMGQEIVPGPPPR